MQEIAKVIGITKPTLYKWIKESDLIKHALTNGKDIADAMVENALFTSAISGNVLAQIFWLKNRRPKQWRDKVVQEIETDNTQECGVVLIAPRLEPNEPPNEEELKEKIKENGK